MMKPNLIKLLFAAGSHLSVDDPPVILIVVELESNVDGDIETFARDWSH